MGISRMHTATGGKETYGDGVCACGEGFAAHVGEEARDLVLVDLVEFGPAVLAGVEDVFAQQILRDLAGGFADLALRVGVHAVFVGRGGCLRLGAEGTAHDGMGAAVGVDDEGGEALVFGGIDGVSDDAQDVETGEDGLR